MGQIVGGRGGGKPTMAQAGGNVPGEIPNAFAAAKKAIS
jgi:alanyl-tRNA synthetase